MMTAILALSLVAGLAMTWKTLFGLADDDEPGRFDFDRLKSREGRRAVP